MRGDNRCRATHYSPVETNGVKVRCERWEDHDGPHQAIVGNRPHDWPRRPRIYEGYGAAAPADWDETRSVAEHRCAEVVLGPGQTHHQCHLWLGHPGVHRSVPDFGPVRWP